MKPAPFEYAMATDVAGAAALLGEANGTAKIIAGGQSLGPMLNFRLVQPALLVDISRCAQLRGFEASHDGMMYGAAITHAEIEDGVVPDVTRGWLRDAASRIAYRAVRNRGTIGGSLAHADPAADWVTVLLGLDAQVIVHRDGVLVASALSEFVGGPFQTTLGADDLVVGVHVPSPSPQARWGYTKISVKKGEFAQAICVAFEDTERERSRLVLGGLGRAPLVLDVGLDTVASLEAADAVVASHLNMDSPVARRPFAVAVKRSALQALDSSRQST
ncbi:MAG: FAD binding domain-containing protein [Gammaproteobacteria bacterium]|nr:FAD binding domain-containing protein [Gammaproteobacteria bacterium]